MSQVSGHDATPDQHMPPPLPAEDAWARDVIKRLARTITDQQHQLVSQAEMIGTLRAELAALRSAGSVRWYRRWRAWLAAGLVVAVVGSASCQTSASVKHAGLCTSARATMDFMAQLTVSGRLMDDGTWSAIQDMIGTAEKVC